MLIVYPDQLRRYSAGSWSEGVAGIDFSEVLTHSETNNVQKPSGVLVMLTDIWAIYTHDCTLCLVEKKMEHNTEAMALKDAYIYEHEKDPYQLNKIKLRALPKLSKRLLTL